MDLEKAFDTIRHELLFELLEINGIPEDMIDVIRRLYENIELKLNSGSAKSTIPYSVGVKQGDVMAPVLFIVLMQAMAETLEDEWEAADSRHSNCQPSSFQGHRQAPRTHVQAGLGHEGHNFQDQSYSLC
jgi:hypothetical protein